jgi:predicted dinucleotide-binding enzyme
LATAAPFKEVVMVVAVIGTGNVGSRVARRLAEGGADVTVAASDLESAQQAAQEIGQGVRAADVKEAIANADLVVFATWFDTTKQLLADNTEALTGKIVADPSNNIAPDGDGFKSLNPEGVSAGQQIARLLPPDTRYVKAFGALGAESLDATRTENGDKVAFFYATDDDAAGAAVADLITQAGWDAVRAGGVEDTARIEVFGDLHEFGGLNGRLLSKSEAETAITNR